MLVAGSVIIGRREEDKEVGAGGTDGAEPTVAVPLQDGFWDEPDAPLAGTGAGPVDCEGEYRDSIELERKPKKEATANGEESD